MSARSTSAVKLSILPLYQQSKLKVERRTPGLCNRSTALRNGDSFTLIVQLGPGIELT